MKDNDFYNLSELYSSVDGGVRPTILTEEVDEGDEQLIEESLEDLKLKLGGNTKLVLRIRKLAMKVDQCNQNPECLKQLETAATMLMKDISNVNPSFLRQYKGMTPSSTIKIIYQMYSQ